MEDLFTSRLSGRRIVITKATEPVQDFMLQVQSLGAMVEVLPCLRVRNINRLTVLQGIIERGDIDWILLENEVAAVVLARQLQRLPVRVSLTAKIAALGIRTARAARRAGLPIHFIAQALQVPDLVELFYDAGIRPRHVFLPAEVDQEHAIESCLRAQTARVSRLEMYARKPILGMQQISSILDSNPDAITFQSPLAAHHFMECVPPHAKALFPAMAFVAIGDQTADTLRAAGVQEPLIAHKPTTSAMVKLLDEQFCRVPEIQDQDVA